MSSLLKARTDRRAAVEVTLESAGWTYLDFRVVQLGAGDGYRQDFGGREVVVVPISGRGVVRVGSEGVELGRAGVFEAVPHVLYVPLGRSIQVSAEAEFVFTIGGAPAEGGLPLRYSNRRRCVSSCGAGVPPTGRSPTSSQPRSPPSA